VPGAAREQPIVLAFGLLLSIALFGRQTGRGKANDDSIVSRQHQVDHDHLDQGHDSVAGDEIGHN
jgi:hypothetical protein